MVKTNTTTNNNIKYPEYAKDIVYTCLSCGKREKEYALKSRFQKVCSSCGGQSVDSKLLESLDYVAGKFTPENN